MVAGSEELGNHQDTKGTKERPVQGKRGRLREWDHRVVLVAMGNRKLLGGGLLRALTLPALVARWNRRALSRYNDAGGLGRAQGPGFVFSRILGGAGEMAAGAEGVVTAAEVVEQLRWRYAVKRFDPAKKIPAETWAALEETLVLTPSSFGLQPWKFFLVESPEVREKLVPATWGQRQVADASHLVVMAIRSPMTVEDVDRHLARMSTVLSTPAERFAGLRKMVVGFMESPGFLAEEWAARQVYIALGQFMATAAMLGVDTCPMEGFVPSQYDEILGLPALGYKTCVLVAAGYRSADDKYATQPKVRFEKGDVIGCAEGKSQK